MTVGCYLALRLAWRGTLDSWDQQYKGFLVGDLLLALIAGLLFSLNQRHPQTHSTVYWIVWAVVGVAGGLMFIASKHSGQAFFRWSYLDSPTTVYHDFLLFAFLIPILGGGGFPLLVPHFGARQLMVIALFVAYISLNWYDRKSLPQPPNPPASWSVAHHLGRT
ncbi:hypothetical protein HJC99_06890 [Candidatus Saccharibacteria bacterium]|nr:hypothetical protein [Candidatus Saccharibacteria bacterium]